VLFEKFVDAYLDVHVSVRVSIISRMRDISHK
jgi:hypothetical protein